jgi:hypothetical protein
MHVPERNAATIATNDSPNPNPNPNPNVPERNAATIATNVPTRKVFAARRQLRSVARACAACVRVINTSYYMQVPFITIYTFIIIIIIVIIIIINNNNNTNNNHSTMNSNNVPAGAADREKPEHLVPQRLAMFLA